MFDWINAQISKYARYFSVSLWKWSQQASQLFDWSINLQLVYRFIYVNWSRCTSAVIDLGFFYHKLNLIDRVCETYDVDVLNWRDDVIDNLLKSQLSVRFISVIYRYYMFLSNLHILSLWYGRMNHFQGSLCQYTDLSL